MASLHPQGPSNQKEKPRERPLSVPSQAAIQGLMSPDLQLKGLQARPQSPGQVQKPQSGSNHVSSPAVTLVSAPARRRSYSPCCRIDVDIEPSHKDVWQKDLRAAVSHESIFVPSDSEATGVDATNPFSQSYPENAFRSALPRRGSYSPTFNSGNLLQVPLISHFLLPPSHSEKRHNNYGLNSLRGCSSNCELSESATGDAFKQNVADRHHMRKHSSGHVYPSSSPDSPIPWLNLSPRASSPLSSSPTSPGQWSLSTLSPPFSPENLEPSITHRGSPSRTHLLLPSHSPIPFSRSLTSTPHCSPYSSPFGSQTQICITSVGM